MKRIIAMNTAAGTAHSNSTTETSLAKKTFAIGELTPGKIIEFEAMLRATSTNSTDTLTPAVRFGTNATDPTANTAVATASAVDVADNNMVVVKGSIHVQSATRFVFHVQINDAGADGTNFEAYSEIFTAVADTAYTLDITGDWSVAHAGNSVQAESFSVTSLV